MIKEIIDIVGIIISWNWVILTSLMMIEVVNPKLDIWYFILTISFIAYLVYWSVEDGKWDIILKQND